MCSVNNDMSVKLFEVYLSCKSGDGGRCYSWGKYRIVNEFMMLWS